MTRRLVVVRVENSVGKGENTDNKHFLLFPSCFQVFFFRGVKNPDCLVNCLNHKSGKYPESF